MRSLLVASLLSHRTTTLTLQASPDVLRLDDAWTLVRDRSQATLSLAPKRDSACVAEEFATVVPRSASAPAIGLALLELGSDGTHAITVVDEVVDGSNAAQASLALRPGDTLLSVSAGGATYPLEACTYDATIDTLSQLDPALGALTFSVRRLRKLPTVQLTLQFPGEERPDEQLTLLPGQPLRQTILARGIKLNDPLALRFDSGGPGDCGGEGCCCTCAVEVVEGDGVLTEAKTQERQMLRNKPSWRLGCRARVSPALDADASLVVRATPRGWSETSVANE